MSENELDPAASTQQFRAFARGGQPEPAKPGISAGLIAAIVVAAIVVIAVVAALALL